MPHKIEISHKTIIFTVLFLVSLWFLYSIRDIIFLVFLALLISIVLNPTVRKLNKWFKVPRVVSVLIVYAAFAAVIVFLIGSILNPFVEQSGNFVKNFPIYLERLRVPDTLIEQVSSEITSQITTISSQLLKIGVSIFSNILGVFAVLVFALYFSVAREKLGVQLLNFLDKEDVDRIDRVLVRLEEKLGGWTRGELILMFLVGVLTYLGLTILGIPYAIPLALLAGILEVVPNIGPVIAAIPPIVVGFGISPITGFAAIALSFLIQQLENYIFVPKVMEKSAGLNPLVTLLALLVGFRLVGVVGAVLSVPVVVSLKVILEEYLPSKS